MQNLFASRFALSLGFALTLVCAGCGDDEPEPAVHNACLGCGDGDGDGDTLGDGDGDGDAPGDGDGDGDAPCVPDDSICPGTPRCREGEPCWQRSELPDDACDDGGTSDEDSGVDACESPTCDDICGSRSERCVENGCGGSTWHYCSQPGCTVSEQGQAVAGSCDVPVRAPTESWLGADAIIECCCE